MNNPATIDMITKSLADYYSRITPQETPHCMRNYHPTQTRHKNMWKIDRGHESVEMKKNSFKTKK